MAAEISDAWSVTQNCKCGAVRFRSITDPDGWNEWRNYFEELDKILRKK